MLNSNRCFIKWKFLEFWKFGKHNNFKLNGCLHHRTCQSLNLLIFINFESFISLSLSFSSLRIDLYGTHFGNVITYIKFIICTYFLLVLKINCYFHDDLLRLLEQKIWINTVIASLSELLFWIMGSLALFYYSLSSYFLIP